MIFSEKTKPKQINKNLRITLVSKFKAKVQTNLHAIYFSLLCFSFFNGCWNYKTPSLKKIYFEKSRFMICTFLIFQSGNHHFDISFELENISLSVIIDHNPYRLPLMCCSNFCQSEILSQWYLSKIASMKFMTNISGKNLVNRKDF